MKSSFILCLFTSLFFSSIITNAQQNELSLKVISPSPKSVLETAGSGTTILGSVYPADSKLSINGTDALIDVDGIFICHTSVILSGEKPDSSGNISGKFIFNISKGNEHKTLEKTYKVKFPVTTSSSDSLTIDRKWDSAPSENLELEKGEAVQVEFKATPGCKGFLKIEGIKDSIPLCETTFINSFYWGEAVFGTGLSSKGDTIGGIYKCSFLINQPLNKALITAYLTHPKLGRLTYGLPGKISTIDESIHRVARVKYDPNLVIGRTSPGGGYKIFLPEGVNLEVLGRRGNWLKTKLSKNESVYVSAYSTDILPEGTPLPSSSIRIIRAKETEKTLSVEFDLSQRLPYIINQTDSPQKIELLLYNVTSDIDWIFYDKKSDFIKDIRHSQTEDGVLKVEIELNQKTHWGYHADYDGEILRLTINKPAKRNSGFLFWNNQLKDRVISIDPGHTADIGAVGPRGTKEKDVNFDISLKLKEMLEDAGAKVFLTHERDKDLPLRDRKAKVNSFNPEISVSMHNNAVPEGVNPIEHNGSSVYYYYLQALPLAKLIHKNLLNELKLKDFGLYWDNLYMCRIPESIAVLAEPAFMIMPEQERLLKTDDFQKKIARSVFNAIKTFYEEYTQ